jgi:hypothetical protein
VVPLDGGQLAIYLEDDWGDVRRSPSTPRRHGHVPGDRARTVRNEFDADAFVFVIDVPETKIEAFARGAAELAADGEPSSEDVVAIAQRHGIAIAGTVPTDS